MASEKLHTRLNRFRDENCSAYTLSRSLLQHLNILPIFGVYRTSVFVLPTISTDGENRSARFSTTALATRVLLPAVQ
jgi:hypothetical protein